MSFKRVVETKLMPVRVQFLNCKKILTGNFDKKMLEQWWTQISKHSNLLNLKKRLTDHLNAAGIKIPVSSIRLWLYSNKQTISLFDICTQLKNSYQNRSALGTSRRKGTEITSGVDFPGHCLEPHIQSELRINQLYDNNCHNIVVEYKDNPSDIFAFKCDLTEKVITGICQACN